MQTFKDFTSNQKTAVFTYGRFNPPTIGHAKLLKKLAELSKIHNTIGFVIPSHTVNNKKDPLTFDEKSKILHQMIQGEENLTINSHGKTLIDALKELQNRGYTTIYQIAGDDRVSEYQDLVNRLNNKPNKSGEIPFSFKNYIVVSAGIRDPDAEGEEGMSASKLRRFAINGDLESFLNGMSNLVDKQTKINTYTLIRARLT